MRGRNGSAFSSSWRRQVNRAGAAQQDNRAREAEERERETTSGTGKRHLMRDGLDQKEW